MSERKETLIIGQIIKKVFSKFNNLNKITTEEFFEECGIEIQTPSETQYYISWLFYEFIFPGGKSFISLIKESIVINKDEKDMINRIENGITGLFEIKQWGKEIIIKDLLTKKEYPVSVLDMIKPNSNLIKANLVKNFNDNYFFFGGIECFMKDEEKKIKQMIKELN